MEENSTQKNRDWRNWVIAILGLTLIFAGIFSGDKETESIAISNGTTMTTVSMTNELCSNKEEIANVAKVCSVSSNSIRIFITAYRDKQIDKTSDLVAELQNTIEMDLDTNEIVVDIPSTTIIAYIIARIPEPGEDVVLWLNRLEYMADGLYQASLILSKTK